MSDVIAFLRWVIVYAVSNGFWHFLGVFFIVNVLTRITTVVWVGEHRNRTTVKRKVKKGNNTGRVENGADV